MHFLLFRKSGYSFQTKQRTLNCNSFLSLGIFENHGTGCFVSVLYTLVSIATFVLIKLITRNMVRGIEIVNLILLSWFLNIKLSYRVLYIVKVENLKFSKFSLVFYLWSLVFYSCSTRGHLCSFVVTRVLLVVIRCHSWSVLVKRVWSSCIDPH